MVFESITKHTRRFSDSFRKSPTKEQNPYFETEVQSQPIRMQFGDLGLVYHNLAWKTDPAIDPKIEQALETLHDRNRVLEAENQLLKFKVNVLLDMLSSTKLDSLQLQAKVASGVKAA